MTTWNKYDLGNKFTRNQVDYIHLMIGLLNHKIINWCFLIYQLMDYYHTNDTIIRDILWFYTGIIIHNIYLG